jgi:hypothetical protein
MKAAFTDAQFLLGQRDLLARSSEEARTERNDGRAWLVAVP